VTLRVPACEWRLVASIDSVASQLRQRRLAARRRSALDQPRPAARTPRCRARPRDALPRRRGCAQQVTRPGAIHLRSYGYRGIVTQIEPSLLSFLKERGRSSPDFVVRIDRSFLDLRRCVARRDRRRCPGSAGGRPRSGRRPWTPAPRGACLFGESDLVVLRILPGCWGVSAPSPVHPRLGTGAWWLSVIPSPRGAAWSCATSCGRVGSFKWGDHASGLGVRHKGDPRPTAVRVARGWAATLAELGVRQQSGPRPTAVRVAHAAAGVRARRQVPSRRA
jgi:hypothetical protein